MDSDSYLISQFEEMNISTRTDMLSKEVAWIPDSNGSSYNGQIVFDLSTLGQSNKWLSYSEAFIEIPYVISAKATTDLTTVIKPESIIMKDGFYSIIDSMSVEFNQKTVVQVQNFTNVHTTFKLLCSSSNEDVIKNGSSTGFLADDPQGYTYSDEATTAGIGYINNGTDRALKTTAFDPTSAMPIHSLLEIINSGTSYYSKSGVAADTYYRWVVMAQIRLKDITDFFDKIPLCKTTDVRLTITYSCSQINVVGSAAAPSLLSVKSYQQLSGHCCPFMLKYTSPDAGSDVTIRSNVVNSGLGPQPTLATGQCRLYVPVYKISDVVSVRMLQSFPITSFEYNDIYSYSVPNIAPGQTFSHTLTTGVVNPQYVVVIPIPNTNSLAGLNTATYQSVFDSSPSTFGQCILNGFNIQIGGLNVFQQDARFDWEMFNNEVAKLFAIHGNNLTGSTSGLLNLSNWKNLYRCYVADLTRREQSNDHVTKSIVVTATNASTAPIDLLCFIAYKKSLSLKTSTGTIAD